MPNLYLTLDELDVVETLLRENLYQLDRRESEIRKVLGIGEEKAPETAYKVERVITKLNSARYQSSGSC